MRLNYLLSADMSIQCLRQNQMSIGQPIHQSQRAICEYKQDTKKPIIPSGNLPTSPKGGYPKSILLAITSLNYERQNNIKKPFFPHKPGVDSQFVPIYIQDERAD